MGFSNGRGEGSSRTFANIYLKKDNQTACFFGVKAKIDGRWQLDKEFKQLENVRLVDIKHQVDEYEGDEFNVVVMVFEDNDGLYEIKSRFNNPSCSIINALANADIHQSLNVSLYVNDKGYPSSSLWQNDELVKWKYGLDDIPRAVEVKVGKKSVWDRSEHDDFFIDVITEISNGLHNIAAPVPVVADDVEESDDLPF